MDQLGNEPPRPDALRAFWPRRLVFAMYCPPVSNHSGSVIVFVSVIVIVVISVIVFVPIVVLLILVIRFGLNILFEDLAALGVDLIFVFAPARPEGYSLRFCQRKLH